MRHQRVMFWVMVMLAATGLVDAAGAGGCVDGAPGLHLCVGLTVSYLGFLWYCADSDARGYRRSRWLSVAVAALAPATIPYYLVRSRTDGERGRALLTYAAYLAAAAFAVWVGMAVRIGLA